MNSFSQTLTKESRWPHPCKSKHEQMRVSDIFVGWHLPIHDAFANTSFWKDLQVPSLALPIFALCPPGISSRPTSLSPCFRVTWCPLSLVKKMQASRDHASHLFHLPKCKVRVWSPWDTTSGAFQARGYTQLNPWVPWWAGEMCKLGTFIYASAAARCAFLPPVLQAALGKPSAVMKTAGQPASFQQ